MKPGQEFLHGLGSVHGGWVMKTGQLVKHYSIIML